MLKALDSAEKRTLTAIGEFVRSEAQARSPVGVYTDGRVGGNLRDSNDYKVDVANSKVIVGDSAEYAIFVHEGTSRQRSQPWLRNSVFDNVSKIKNLISEMMRL